MLTPRFLAASVLALGITAGPLFAQGTTRTEADARFAQLDADRDGFLTRAEASQLAGLAQRFDRFDADRDGKLDRAEFAAVIASMK